MASGYNQEVRALCASVRCQSFDGEWSKCRPLDLSQPSESVLDFEGDKIN